VTDDRSARKAIHVVARPTERVHQRRDEQRRVRDTAR
jgi:hypothetical protein